MSNLPQDDEYMRQALLLAEKGRFTTQPNPRVGCVIVKEGKVIAEGWHRKAGEPHAEINALAQINFEATGATAYVTLEPCSHFAKTPPCVNSLIKANITRVVVAMQDPNPQVSGRGIQALRDAGIEVDVGLMQKQAQLLNKGFCHRMITGRPRVFSKIAMSLDGRTAMESGESQWITGTESRLDVHQLRAESGVVLTGIGTVLADDPTLNARDGFGKPLGCQPLRVILDSHLKTPINARMLSAPGECVILTCNDDKTKQFALKKSGFVVQLLPSTEQGQLDLQAVVDWLGSKEINDVMVEAGSVLNGALLESNLLDELIIYIAPIILGDKGRGVFHMPALNKLAECPQFVINKIQSLGTDIKMNYDMPKEG